MRRPRVSRTARQVRTEVEEELRFHLERRAAELERGGMRPEAAWEEALRRFGDVDATRDACYGSDLRRERRVSRRERLSDLVQDVRYGARQLRRRPLFTVAAVLTLAIGIGAATAIFSAADHVVLRPLPYAEPDRVVTLWETDVAAGDLHKEVSPGNFVSWVEAATSFTAAGLAEPSSVDLTGGDGPPLSVPTWAVTEGYLEALGVRPIMGRGFQAAHFAPGGPSAVMISHGLWQRRFGGDPAVVGTTFELDGRAVPLVGVLPPWAAYPSAKDVWTPKAFRPGEPDDRRSAYMHAVARLRPGITAEAAQAELDAVAATLGRAYPRTNAEAGVRLVPLHDEVVGGVRPALLVLLGAVGFLLLIACVNVAHLLLSRAAERGDELSVRAALGAGRLRLARQLMTESLLLALLGGTAGLALALGGVEAIVALSPPELPRIGEVGIDARVLAFAAAVTLSTALLFGLAPSLRLARSDALATLRGGRRSHTGDRRSTRVRDALVVAEIAVAMVLLVGAGLLARSFTGLLNNDPGFRVEGRATLQAFLWDRNPTPQQRIDRVAEIDAALEALPGVRGAAVVSALPFHPSRIISRIGIEVVGRPVAADAVPEVDVLIASPDYFRVMGIALLRGQVFAERAAPESPTRVVVNEALAERFFEGADPVGASIVLRGSGEPVAVEVAGVVAGVRPTTFASDPVPELYLPYERNATGSVTFVVAGDGPAAALMPAVRQRFWDVDPEQSIYHEATMEQLVSATLLERRFHLLLIGAFSLVALALSGIGVFGVISFAASRRTNEIGIRIALGARPGDVARSVLRHGLRLGLPGVLLGAAAALGLTRFLSGMLYGVRPTDPLTFARTGALLLGIALLAAYLPARRAARVDPATALRAE